jgi:hypothetical protein
MPEPIRQVIPLPGQPEYRDLKSIERYWVLKKPVPDPFVENPSSRGVRIATLPFLGVYAYRILFELKDGSYFLMGTKDDDPNHEPRRYRQIRPDQALGYLVPGYLDDLTPCLKEMLERKLDPLSMPPRPHREFVHVSSREGKGVYQLDIAKAYQKWVNPGVDLVPPNDRCFFISKDGRHFQFCRIIRSHDGRWISHYSYPMPGSDPRSPQFMVIFAEITRDHAAEIFAKMNWELPPELQDQAERPTYPAPLRTDVEEVVSTNDPETKGKETREMEKPSAKKKKIDRELMERSIADYTREYPQATNRGLAKALGVSSAYINGTKGWKSHHEKKKAQKPPRKSASVFALQATGSFSNFQGKEPDPSDNIDDDARALLERRYLESASEQARARYHESNKGMQEEILANFLIEDSERSQHQS